MRALRLTLALVTLMVTLASAQDKKADMAGTVKGSFAKQSKFVEGQITSLLQAIPQDKMTWKPGEGVRSVSEAFLHVALGNYITLSKITGKMPEGVDPKTFEKSSTDKAKITDEIKKSFIAVNGAVSNAPESDYGKTVDFFGNPMTILDMIFVAATHQHETLGQQIAY
ncbi:MAG: DinB family protein, partial [Bacteroidetes bacterium]|nr:DinB family protein [Bacteroidota bacterium]